MAVSLLQRIVAPYRIGLAGLDRRVYVIVTLTLLAVGSRMSLYTFLGIYFTREVHLALSVVGAAFLVENVGRGLAAPTMGALSDRVGRRPVIVGAALATAAVLPLFLLVDASWQLFAWAAALGGAQAGMWPATSALLMDLTPADRRQSVLSLNYTAISVGYTLGVAPAGFLVMLGYPVLAVVSAAGFLAIAFAALFAIRGPLPPTRAPEARSSFAADLARAPLDPAFLFLAALAVVFPLGIGLVATVAPLYAAQSGLSEGAIGLALAVNGPLLAAFAIPVAVWLTPRGPYRFLAVSAGIIALGYLPLAVGGSFLPLVLASVVFTVGELIFSSAVPTAVASLAPRGLQGGYQGAWVFVFAVGSGSALFLTGLVQPWLGWSATWLAWSGATALAAVGLALARPRFRRVADARAAQEKGEAAPAASPA